MLLCQQCNGAIILPNKCISLSGGLLIIFYMYFSVLCSWFDFDSISLESFGPSGTKFSLAPLIVVELCHFLPLAPSTLHFPVRNKASDVKYFLKSILQRGFSHEQLKILLLSNEDRPAHFKISTQWTCWSEKGWDIAVYFFSPWKKRRLHQPLNWYYCNKLCSSLPSSWKSPL